jgi:hypothetical protein
MTRPRFLTLVVTLSLSVVPVFGQAGKLRTVAATEVSTPPPAIVIGFLGGFVGQDDHAHSTVQLTAHLREQYSSSLYAEAFENHHRRKALNEILWHLDVDHDGKLSLEEKQNARVIIFGHSWGGSETVTLARKLQRLGVPVLLTIQVDSVSKIGENDSIIPANVEKAANFFQPDGLIHGRPEIRAANPARTEIIGNFKVDYKLNPIRCGGYPWFDRIFMRPHIEIECDRAVWSKVESLIASRLSQ